jgi:hypothetical protein
MLLQKKIAIFNYVTIFLIMLSVSCSLHAVSSLRIKAPNTVQASCGYKVGAVIQQTFTTNSFSNSAPSVFKTPSAGGTLCPGQYSAFARCSHINTQTGGNPCSGSSCGWNIDLYSGSTVIASRAGHDGCVTDYGNFCENQGDSSLWTGTGTLDTNVNGQSQGITDLNFSVEGGQFGMIHDNSRGGFCTIQLTAIRIY